MKESLQKVSSMNNRKENLRTLCIVETIVHGAAFHVGRQWAGIDLGKCIYLSLCFIVMRGTVMGELKRLKTTWGEQLNHNNILKEYPRPQMVRDSYVNLNGSWNYIITKYSKMPNAFTGVILVPFSPESQLSGVNRTLQPDEYLWYSTYVYIDCDKLSAHRVILNFGAIDYYAEIFINDVSVEQHCGGYTPFSVDITEYAADVTHIVIKVTDSTGKSGEMRGKQSLKNGGILYQAQSGIWQSVWMEYVPKCYIQEVHINADYETRRVHIDAFIIDEESNSSTIKSYIDIAEENFRPWSPEDPYLYQVMIEYGEDKVETYFAFRTYTIESIDGIPRFCLNHKPYFLNGILDQGYWSDGLYTAPSDAALIYDISLAKGTGFNMLRKHIKVECARWYYHCDRLGMIVCQDIPSGGSNYQLPVLSMLPAISYKFIGMIKDTKYHKLLGWANQSEYMKWLRQAKDIVYYLRQFPCIAIWTAFNEGWGQINSDAVTKMIKDLAPTTLVDSASGWFDQGCGDFISVHNYFRKLTVPIKKWGNRAFIISEYGGYSFKHPHHSASAKAFGYKQFNTIKSLNSAVSELFRNIKELEQSGLSGAVYTQLSDVEDEVNGLITYDRKCIKISKKRN